jgi:ribonuclease P protein subunit RPR2
MAKRRSIGRGPARKIARERMNILLKLAEDNIKKDKELSRRYVSLARRIGSRCNVRLNKKDKLAICKDCNSFLIPGLNCRVRTHSTRVVRTCLECGRERRVPFIMEKKGKFNK